MSPPHDRERERRVGGGARRKRQKEVRGRPQKESEGKKKKRKWGKKKDHQALRKSGDENTQRAELGGNQPDRKSKHTCKRRGHTTESC